MPVLFDLRRERNKRPARVGRMMQHADAKGIIERPFKWQLENIALDDMYVRNVAGQGECRFDGDAEIETDDFLCSPFRGELGVTALATAAFEHDLVLKKLGFHRLQPAKHLIGIHLVFLSKMRPLPPKIPRRFGLVLLDLIQIGKPRYP